MGWMQPGGHLFGTAGLDCLQYPICLSNIKNIATHALFYFISRVSGTTPQYATSNTILTLSSSFVLVFCTLFPYPISFSLTYSPWAPQGVCCAWVLQWIPHRGFLQNTATGQRSTGVHASLNLFILLKNLLNLSC